MSLPPSKIGDKGQRFEIAVRDLSASGIAAQRGENIEQIGYAEDAFAFHKAIEMHPRWRRTPHQILITDRKPGDQIQ